MAFPKQQKCRQQAIVNTAVIIRFMFTKVDTFLAKQFVATSVFQLLLL